MACLCMHATYMGGWLYDGDPLHVVICAWDMNVTWHALQLAKLEQTTLDGLTTGHIAITAV